MPWEAILAGGVPTLALVLVAYLLYTAITKAVEAASSNFLDVQKSLRAFTQTVDSDLRTAERLIFHPNDNTASLTISAADFVKFLESRGNTVRWVSV